MATSQNGWTVLEERPPLVTVPGTDVRLAIRPGDVAWLLTRLAAWIHANVERLDTPVIEDGRVLPTDDWGWALRPIRDRKTGYSNHASGTAIDLNATQHPRGVKRTWAPSEVTKIHNHLDEYEGLIRWGEDYSTTVDGMHFEIVGTVTQVHNLRVRLQARDAADAAGQDQESMLNVVTHAGRYYVLDGNGKREISKVAVDELVRVGAAKVRGGVGAVTLTEFPTYQDGGTEGGITVNQLVAADDLPPNTTPQANGDGG